MIRLIAVLVILGVIAWFCLGGPPPQKPQSDDRPPIATAGAATPAPRMDKLGPILSVAKKQHVTVQLTEIAGGARAEVSWTGDVATLGGDFLQALMDQQIIHDFAPAAGASDSLGGQGISTNVNGQRVWFAKYDLKY